MYTRAKITSLFYGYKNADKYLHMRLSICQAEGKILYTIKD